jgi:hypothetical protein
VWGVFARPPFDPADSPRKLHHTHSPGKHQISNMMDLREGVDWNDSRQGPVAGSCEHGK